VKSTVESLGPTRVRIAVEVPFDELRPSMDAALKRLSSQVRIPGFRPGKAPARIVEQRVGRAALLEDAVNEAIPRAYAEAVRESSVKTIGQPDVEVTRLEDGDSLAFTAEVDVTGHRAARVPEAAGHGEKAEVTDEQVTEHLERCASGSPRSTVSSGLCRPVTMCCWTSWPRSTAPRSRAAPPRVCPTRSAPTIWSRVSTKP
jgi:trigger factor